MEVIYSRVDEDGSYCMQVGFNTADCETLATVLEEDAGFSEEACEYTSPCADASLLDPVSNTAAYVASMCANGADDFVINALCPGSGNAKRLTCLV